MGGLFVSRLACSIRGLAGIAALAGSFYQDPRFDPVAPPRRVFLAHGIYDSVIPYAGGMADHGEFYEPVENVARMWSMALGCNQEVSVNPAGEGVTEIRYSPCRGAGAVLLLKVEFSHHVYDGVDGLFLKIWDFWQGRN
jgi:poly(3-hydroxybutyrate) depolymerase